jgi:hypothetical protein
MAPDFGGELRAAGGLRGPPARALRDEVGAEVQQRSQRPTGQRGCRLVPIRGTQCWQWLWQLCGSVFVLPLPPSPRGCRRRQPRGDQIHSPANLIDADRPRGLTRDTDQRWIAVLATDTGLKYVYSRVASDTKDHEYSFSKSAFVAAATKKNVPLLLRYILGLYVDVTIVGPVANNMLSLLKERNAIRRVHSSGADEVYAINPR